MGATKDEEIARTPYGERLFLARTGAKLSQAALARAGRISQSTLWELERIGEGSSATVRMATACKVRPEWLSEGEGPMRQEPEWPFRRVPLDRVRSLDDEQLAYVEGQLDAAIEKALEPTPTEVGQFVKGHLGNRAANVNPEAGVKKVR